MTLPLIDRYIAKSVMVAIAAVLVCAVSLTGVFALIDEAGGVDQNYTFVNAAAYVLYNLPSQMYESVPFVVFIGSLIGLGTLSTHSEITVLRAAGISLGRLLIPVALPSVLVLTLSLLVAEYVAPWGVQSAAGMKIQQRQVSEDIRFTNRYWHREGNRFTSIEGVTRGGHLLGVMQWEINGDNEMQLARRARSAEYDPDLNLWWLKNVDETHFGSEATKVVSHDEVQWRTRLNTRLVRASIAEPRKLGFSDLAFQIDYREQEGLDPRRYQLAYWGKLLQPLAILGLITIALGFVVGPLREVGMGARFSVGVVVGVVLKYLQDLLPPMSMVFDFPAWVAVLIPIGVVWGFGIYLVRRVS
ncbi:MAG: LPS export ABC transporter permease LptG [Pseudomonadota bacterium]|nr:LPS export ABC transporter permease LptG [Pseudomonadota bacterium]